MSAWALALEKSVRSVEDTNGDGRRDAGDRVTYQFVTTNTGTVTVSNVSVAETAFSGSGTMSALSCDPAQPATLAPGQKMTCAATYDLTQADVDAGTVTNTAVANGEAPNPADPSRPLPVTTPPDSAQVETEQIPAINLVKTVASIDDMNGNGLTDSGDVVTYMFVATNTGTITITDVEVVETAFSGTGALSPLTCDRVTPATLAPAQVLTCTAMYTITKADANVGHVSNTAIAAGQVVNPDDPNNPSTVTSAPSDALVPTEVPPAKPSDGSLAYTGAEVGGIAGFAGLAIVAGAGLLVIARRRRSS